MYDIVIKGGRIVDGSGEKSFIGDIAVVKKQDCENCRQDR